jgi:hypothetical protein
MKFPQEKITLEVACRDPGRFTSGPKLEVLLFSGDPREIRAERRR